MDMQLEIFSLMERGGPVMWVILTAAVIAMMLLSWQGMYVFLLTRSARRDYTKLTADKHFVPRAINGIVNSPIAQLLEKIRWDDVTSRDDVVKEMNIHMTDILPGMNYGLSTIGVLGSLLPMLGLLGTVTGMINVFEVIALRGSGDAEAMAGGISQALLTTAGGLIIAIPVIFFHHLLANRINTLMDITGQAMQVVQHRDVSLFRGAHDNV